MSSESSSKDERPHPSSVDSALAAKYRAEAARALSETIANFCLALLYCGGFYAIITVVKIVRSLL